jgi:glucan phosphoethanolaminetransferase (alkaline phosphatase superfamily)
VIPLPPSGILRRSKRPPDPRDGTRTPWLALLAWGALLSVPGIAAVPLWPWIPSDPGVESPVSLAVADGSVLRALIGPLGFALLLACARNLRLTVLLTAPFVLLAPLETQYIVVYGGPTTAHILGVIAETSRTEAGEFLNGMPLRVPATLIASWGIALWSARSLWRSGWRWQHDSWKWYAAIVVGMGAVAGVREATTGDAPPVPEVRGASLLASSALSASWTDFQAVYPWGVPLRIVDYLGQRAQVARALERAQGLRFGATLQPSLPPRTVVLVIGESVGAAHFGLDGAQRDTTPRLAQVHGLVNFSDATSAAAATRISLPFMLTPLKPGEDLARNGPGKSLVSAFAEAGYRTWWLSNQAAIGRYDTPVATYPREAQVRRFISLGDMSTRSAYDGELLREVERALREPAPHRLIVVHQLGSHWDYAQRYPKAFERWQPTMLPGKRWNTFARDMKHEIANAYDNSILYTDSVLADLIAMLDRGGEPAALLYASDHGQALFAGTCLTAGHGLLSATNFHVPFFVWMSAPLRTQQPAMLAALEGNRGRPITAESILPTLLDLGGVVVPSHKHTLSLASGDFSPQPRLVTNDGSTWVDYDHALEGKDCAVVKAKRADAAK